MREWIAFPVITAHLPLPYFRLWCSETLDNGETHPPLLSHCWPLSFHKFLSNFRYDLCVPPPSHVYRATAFPCLPDPFEQKPALLKSKLDKIPLSTLLLSHSVSIPCSCPSYQFHILKLQHKTWAPHLRKTSNCWEITLLQLYTVKSSCTAFLFAQVWGFTLWSHLCTSTALPDSLRAHTAAHCSQGHLLIVGLWHVGSF